jgi:hypothetical protein
MESHLPPEFRADRLPSFRAKPMAVQADGQQPPNAMAAEEGARQLFGAPEAQISLKYGSGAARTPSALAYSGERKPRPLSHRVAAFANQKARHPAALPDPTNCRRRVSWPQFPARRRAWQYGKSFTVIFLMLENTSLLKCPAPDMGRGGNQDFAQRSLGRGTAVRRRSSLGLLAERKPAWRFDLFLRFLLSAF